MHIQDVYANVQFFNQIIILKIYQNSRELNKIILKHVVTKLSLLHGTFMVHYCCLMCTGRRTLTDIKMTLFCCREMCTQICFIYIFKHWSFSVPSIFHHLLFWFPFRPSITWFTFFPVSFCLCSIYPANFNKKKICFLDLHQKDIYHLCQVGCFH